MYGPAARALLLSAAAGVALVTGGCGSSKHSSSPTTTAASRSFQASTPSGQVSVSLDGKLPPNWPQNFPTPEGAKPAGSGSLARSESGTQVGVYTSGASGSDTLSFYTHHAGLTTSDVKSAGVGSSYVGTATITAPYTGSVSVVSHSATTYVIVVLTGSTPASSSTTGV